MLKELKFSMIFNDMHSLDDGFSEGVSLGMTVLQADAVSSENI